MAQAVPPLPALDPPPAPTSPQAVYVHAPFCARRCFYCDFAVTVVRAPDAIAWVDAVAREWRAILDEGRFVPRGPLETLYIGGGTPSLLGSRVMSSLAKALEGAALGDPGIEWTCEANPESLTPEVAHAWRSAGVNRISLGVQSWNPAALRWMGRMHGAEQVRAALRSARGAGFSNLSVDLIFGLPESLDRSWREDLEEALSLDVPHLSLYGLTVGPDTPLGRAVADGTEQVAREDRYRDEYLYASERLTAEGYTHYEVSNFARPGFHSRHNAAYWTGAPYLGLGNSAHSFLPPLRRWNLREWEAYLNAVSRGLLPVEASEELSPQARRLERIWLGLRTAGGIRRSALPPRALKALVPWVRRGWAEGGPDRVRLTPAGWLILDRLAVDLDAACDA